ncbi:MAG: ATP-binding protein [Acidobacteriota bacterium]|nr:ATP-binding protein [Acidobacteriota bacterium]
MVARWCRSSRVGGNFGLLLTVFLCALPGQSQDRNISFRHVAVEQNVSSVLQDPVGFMWFGTPNGLVRYDGYDLLSFRHTMTDEHSLSNNKVNCLYVDRAGNLWVGTSGGLDRFDARTERFVHYRKQDKAESLGIVWSILEDRAGNIWVGTDQGLELLDPESGKFTPYRHQTNRPDSLGEGRVTTIVQDKSGRVWVGTDDGGLSWLDQRVGRFKRFLVDEKHREAGQHHIRAAWPDPQGSLWVATDGGLLHLDAMGNERAAYRHVAGDPNSLPADAVRHVYGDSKGSIWVATGVGLAELNPTTGDFRRYRHDPSDDRSLGNDMVNMVTMDAQEIMWVATSNGLSKWDTNASFFTHFKADSQRQDSLNHNLITAVSEDRDGSLWIGAVTGLDHYDPKNKKWTHYVHDPARKDSLSSNRISSLLVDYRGRLWVGTMRSGLNMKLPGENRFQHFFHDPANPNSLGSNRVSKVRQGAGNTLWISCYRGGLNRLNTETGQFTMYEPNQTGQGSGHRIIEVLVTNEAIWLGTLEGLYRFDPGTERFTGFKHDPEKPAGLSADGVTTLYEDAAGVLWIGTNGFGLNRWEPEDRAAGRAVFRRYGVETGLPGDTINGILGDAKGMLWISTSQGLVRFNPKDEKVNVFDTYHGLQGKDFVAGSTGMGRDGTMYFGGTNGLNAFHPARIHGNTYPPAVVISDFRIFNKSVLTRAKDPDSILDRPIYQTESLLIPYQSYVFGFEVSALHYSTPEKNQYAYMLEGLDTDWNYVDHSQRNFTYTTLTPGDYTLKVKAANADGIWAEEPTVLAITVESPPWLSWWAYTLYALTILGLVLSYIYYQRKKLADKMMVIEQLRRVDKLKDDFLANTSHELRTPLNGIIGLTESLLDGVAGKLNDTVKSNLEMVVNSGRRLATLVDDVLDFSKLKNSSLELNLKPVDLRTLTEVVLTLSEPLVGGKDVRLINEVPSDLPPVEADENRLLQILHNLVGNGIKFTDRGHIKVSALLRGEQVAVYVSDTGIGISADQQEHVFGQFNQVHDADQSFGGTGLGLTITRELIELHGGEISLSSAPNAGSTFSFQLRALPGEEAVTTSLSLRPVARVQPAVPSEEDMEALDNNDEVMPTLTGTFHILIVDDEPVNRQVLINHLAIYNYVIHEAANGREALRILVETERIDLVLLDIMMPRMSGYQVCRELRAHHPMHELPIIFLTAKNQLADLVTGFDCGANDYLTKPVSKQELVARVETHLRLLDITRTLEQKVVARTRQLADRNEELETLDRIVETINREVTLKRVLQSVLDQGLALFPQSERGTFLVRGERDGYFVPAATAGEHAEMMGRVRYTQDELLDFFTHNAERIGRDAYLLHNLDKTNDETRSRLSMAVSRGGMIEGFLILDNFSDPQAFDRSDLRMLARFREHAVSALSKARFLEELKRKNLEILETEKKLAMQEKMASLGTLTAGVAHEIRNPLNFINNFSQFAVDYAAELRGQLESNTGKTIEGNTKAGMADLVEMIEENGIFIHKHGQRAAHIVRSMMELSHGKQGVAETVAVNSFVVEHAQLALQGGEEGDLSKVIELKCECDGNVGKYKVVAQSLGRVLINLVNNAAEATMQKAGGRGMESYHPRIEVTTRDLEDDFEICIRDNGPGIPEENRETIYTPFFTTKENQDNIGLGLAICYDIVTRVHQGELTMDTVPGEYAAFTVRLPKEPVTKPAERN